MQKLRQALSIVVFALALLLAMLVALNLASLRDGLLYLRDLLNYSREQITPLDANGRYGFCFPYVRLNNAERAAFIQNYLRAHGVDYELLEIPSNSVAKNYNIFVRTSASGAYTIFSGHYDKVYQDSAYEGASDNSAADCALMVAAAELHQHPPPRPVAILFTGLEEVGLRGARAFVTYTQNTGLEVKEVINFDNIGRGGLGVRPSGARPGFYFNLPPWGERVYDGRALYPGAPYRPLNRDLVARVQSIAPLTVFEKMIATSDGMVFEEAGIPAINLSTDNIYFLDRTWHTYADRIELLDQRNLDRALELILAYAQSNAQ